jgi:hypothetical protein
LNPTYSGGSSEGPSFEKKPEFRNDPVVYEPEPSPIDNRNEWKYEEVSQPRDGYISEVTYGNRYEEPYQTIPRETVTVQTVSQPASVLKGLVDSSPTYDEQGREALHAPRGSETYVPPYQDDRYMQYGGYQMADLPVGYTPQAAPRTTSRVSSAQTAAARPTTTRQTSGARQVPQTQTTQTTQRRVSTQPAQTTQSTQVRTTSQTQPTATTRTSGQTATRTASSGSGGNILYQYQNEPRTSTSGTSGTRTTYTSGTSGANGSTGTRTTSTGTRTSTTGGTTGTRTTTTGGITGISGARTGSTSTSGSTQTRVIAKPENSQNYDHYQTY